MKRGFFITIEGSEGVGKSTQVQRLADELMQRGYPVIITREPGATAIGKKIRALLLDPRHNAITPITELFLYCADRAQHCDEIIAPHLAEGMIVISDRFMDATNSYQGFGRGLGLTLTEKLNRIVVRENIPNITLMLMDTALRGLKRAKAANKEFGKGGDRLEKEAVSFHKKLIAGYRTLARRRPKRITCIQADAGIEEMTVRLLQATLPELERHHRAITIPNKLRITKAHVSDADTIAALLRTGYTPHKKILNLTAEEWKQYPAHVRAADIRSAMKSADIYIGYYNNKAVATVNISPALFNDSVREIKRLTVLPRYRHRGFGIQMIRFCETMLRRNACREAWLGFIAHDVGLRKYYTQLGYVYDHVWYDPQYTKLKIILMKKKLYPPR